ncbi:MAG: TetR/AcrR family transcriptional regulator [Chloroflexi bacterium]|nr:TetR/AcrR family transcriptional regulator [Chloroflexota bacterium]
MSSEWNNFQPHILQLEKEGKVTRTFRRLDPERQQAVINAILEEATERGPASLNIKEIARRAGVAVGSLYQYFPNRDGLLDFAIELCVRHTTDLFQQFRPMLASMPLRDALSAYLMGGMEWGQTEMGLVRFFGRAAYQGDPDLAERVVRPIATVMRETLQEIFSQAQARGEIPHSANLGETTRIANALIIAVGDSQLFPYLNSYFQITDESVSSEKIMTALVEFILRGIGAGAG